MSVHVRIFFEVVVEAHIISAALEVFEMSSIDDSPSSTFFPEESISLHPQERKKVFLLAIRAVIDKFVDLSFPTPASECGSDHV